MNHLNRTIITLEGWYFIGIMAFVLAGALLRQMNLLILLFGLMAGPLYLNWRMVVFSLRRIGVVRSAPKFLAAGEKLVVDLRVTNESKRSVSWAVRVEDKLSSNSLPGTVLRPRLLFNRVGGGETVTESYEGVIPARGKYRLGPLKVSTRFPLGLVRRTVIHRTLDEVTVYPRLGRLAPAWKERLQEAYHGSRPVKRQQGLMEGDFHALRGYRDGDSMRWIHWRTTARRGFPMVKQFEQQRHHDLALMLDLWMPVEPSSADLENVELAISFAATVVSDLCHRGSSQLLLGTGGREVDVTRGPASRGLFLEIMEHLATVTAGSNEQLPQLLEQSFGQIVGPCDLVLISTRDIDFSTRNDLKSLWQDLRKQNLLSKVLRVNAGNPDIFRYFAVT